jgi:hypothetical protein
MKELVLESKFFCLHRSVITQSSYFLTTAANGIILDPRLFYAPPLIDVMANQTDGNITTVTGGTLGIFPLYLIGHIQANQLRSVAEILKITYAESNRGLNPDEVDVAIVSLDDGVSFSQTRRLFPLSCLKFVLADKN